MDKKEFVKIMNSASKIYGKELDQEVIELWLSFFIDYSTDEFRLAMKEHIDSNNYFPTIATIKDRIYKMKHKDEKTNDELWNSLVKAIGNGSYHAQEEFDKLPELVKRYIVNPKQLQEMASMDSDIIHSVVKGQFMKSIEKIKENYKDDEMFKTGRNLLQEKHIYQLEEVNYE